MRQDRIVTTNTLFLPSPALPTLHRAKFDEPARRASPFRACAYESRCPLTLSRDFQPNAVPGDGRDLAARKHDPAVVGDVDVAFDRVGDAEAGGAGDVERSRDWRGEIRAVVPVDVDRAEGRGDEIGDARGGDGGRRRQRVVIRADLDRPVIRQAAADEFPSDN